MAQNVDNFGKNVTYAPKKNIQKCYSVFYFPHFSLLLGRVRKSFLELLQQSPT
jgi:hypothetical protein